MANEQDKHHYAHKTRFTDRLKNNQFMSKKFRSDIVHGRYSDRALDSDLEKGTATGSRVKLIVSGHVVEKYDYEKPVRLGKKARIIDPETGEVLNGGRTKEVELDPLTGEIVKKECRKEEAKRTNARRSKMDLRRIVLSNFNNYDKFLTLTFRDGSVDDVSNVNICNKAFDGFIKRLRRKYGDFKYCRVIEFQDGNGRGAVHYHCILTLPYVPYQQLGDIWTNGFVGVNAIEHVDNVGAYIQKYMTKDFNDNRLAGKKAFATSQNLTRPIVTYGKEAEELFNSFLREKEKVFANEYVSEHHGKITYSEYNMQRGV